LVLLEFAPDAADDVGEPLFIALPILAGQVSKGAGGWVWVEEPNEFSDRGR